MSAIAFSVMYCILVISFLLSRLSRNHKHRVHTPNQFDVMHLFIGFQAIFFLDVHIMHICICTSPLMIGNYYFSESFAFRMASVLKIFA